MGGVTSNADGTRIAAVVSGGQRWSAYTKEGSNVPPQKLVWTTHSDPNLPDTRDWSIITSSSSGDKLGAAAKDSPLYIGTSNKTTTDDYTWTWKNYTSDSNGDSLFMKWAAITSNVAGDMMVAVVNGGYIYTYNEANDEWSPTATKNTWVSVSASDDGRVLG